MACAERKTIARCIPFKFAAGGLEVTAIFIGRAAELTPSESYCWVKSDKRTGQVNKYDKRYIIQCLTLFYFQARIRYLEKEMCAPNVWRNLHLRQAEGVKKISATVMRKEAQRIMTTRKQELSKYGPFSFVVS